ncbi:unnamed protein product [Rotaria magnacalcarata]|uniref:Adenylate kinase isoenzyme 6 homolog n=3 Tax=Rotaria magnacalcarata TaxID=392030 RepID=A0A815EQK7_9BILA|nr:unnamed protein product [Rotaria magnacalcarata]CAF1474070.1 unnamed protein product [Rotaria magnacalcarata]CAF2037315.1 unnamed protein product [Rotaria magnacalcarata]CAF3885807.1 unnamed protein product [Rotaria magnacalcarata]
MSMKKQLPNIIICGTPGVGKSDLGQQLRSSNKSLKYININDLAKKNKFIVEYDEENQCDILDDDAINDYLDEKYFQKLTPSGLVIDYHSAGIIPDNNQIHGIFVLRCNGDKLNERLKTRNYSEKKIEQIIQSETFQVCLHEACEVFDESMVHELVNETENDSKKNLEYLLNWIDRWPLTDNMD